MVRHHGDVRFALENLHGKHGQRTLGADFDKDAAACVVHGFDLFGPLDRRGHLWRELFQNRRFGISPLHGVEGTVNVSGDGDRWPSNLQTFQKPAKGFVGWSNNSGVERM